MCLIRGMIGHTVFSGSYVYAGCAVKFFEARFSRAMGNSGTGENSSFDEIYDGIEAQSLAGYKGIGDVIISKVEISEYVVEVRFNIDLTGSTIDTASVFLDIELWWGGFARAPTISAV